MNQNKETGVKRMLFSMLSLYSTIIYAVALTVVLYLIRACTNLDMKMDSVFGAFVFVSVVTILNPLTFLIDIFFSIISEMVSFLPKTFFLFTSKLVECLFLIWVISKVDMAIDAVQFSLYAQIVFAFAVHFLTSLMTGQKDLTSHQTKDHENNQD
ncbi:hypothetical protein ACFVS2_21795 [Brevibacillus sp. NPDC058079]|uniref:hypothetical protein n=1 Tax=Brevibacillus sp. NPDC058079 TaxID=3346330 RepID=UPI0036E0398A